MENTPSHLRSVQLLKGLIKEAKDYSKDNNLKKQIKEEVMPSSLKKRRIIYCEDNLWKKIEEKSQKECTSMSSALRIILEKGLSA